MKMTAFAAFYDYLMPELPGITTALLDLHLRDVARDYCSFGLAWHAPLMDIATDGCDSSTAYPLQMQVPNTDLVRLLKMESGPCDASSSSSTGEPTLYWQAMEPPGPLRSDYAPLRRTQYPRFRIDQPPFTLSDDGGAVTFTQPIDASVVTFTAAIKPAIGATQLPEFFLSDKLDAIRAGVFARLMRMSKKPWSDPMGAGAYASEWQGWLHHKAGEALRGNQGALLRTTKTSI